MIDCAFPTPVEKELASHLLHVSQRTSFRQRLARKLVLVIPAALTYLIAIANLAFAATNGICDGAARQAAAETGVPFVILWSLTRAETGRPRGGELRPWPWTVNMEGSGQWFETRDAAKGFVFQHYNRGARSFDIGCFQINHRWHGASFRSIDHMFEPLENARYAASFLQRLYREFGNWSAAVGAYHSRTPEYANSYRARFERIRRGHHLASSNHIAESEGVSNTTFKRQSARQNNYPLLVNSGSIGSRGSLVSLSNDQSRALFNLPRTSEGS